MKERFADAGGRAGSLLLFRRASARAFRIHSTARRKLSREGEGGICVMPGQPIRPISQVWINRLRAARIPTDGTVVEVAPGKEPKVGTALAVLGFVGTIVLIEPDRSAGILVQYLYRQILPNATVRLVVKPLHEVEVGIDIPKRIDALVANHAFDDMVMSSILGQTSPPSDEAHASLTPDDYLHGIQSTVLAWKTFIGNLVPASLIVSQYPVRILARPGFEARQHSGFEVLEQLRLIFDRHASKLDRAVDPTNHREDPRWWLVARFRPARGD